MSAHASKRLDDRVVSGVGLTVMGMEWLVMGAGAIAVIAWLFGRSGEPTSTPERPARPAAAAGLGAAAGTAMNPLAADVARRAADPNNPDGAFMDGYVSGRYTERWLARDPRQESPQSTDRHNWSTGDDEADDMDWETSDRNSVWADPDDSFHDDASDDW